MVLIISFFYSILAILVLNSHKTSTSMYICMCNVRWYSFLFHPFGVYKRQRNRIVSIINETYALQLRASPHLLRTTSRAVSPLSHSHFLLLYISSQVAFAFALALSLSHLLSRLLHKATLDLFKLVSDSPRKPMQGSFFGYTRLLLNLRPFIHISIHIHSHIC